MRDFMNNFQKITVCVLVLSMLFAFVSCKNDDVQGQQNSTTTSTTKAENTTDKETTTTSTTVADTDINLAGTWIYDEKVTPQVFYSEFYNAEITKTNIEMRTTYKFNSNGTVSIGVSIANISEVRKEYRSLMVEAGRINVESKGDYLTPDDVLYYEDYADKVLKQICSEQKGKYTIDGNKIVYTINGETYYETFTINGSELILTGSSNSDKGYPITMTKM